MKAYRKLAAQWHPDQYTGNDKEKAEKMFIDIAAAKEVLTDPGNNVLYYVYKCCKTLYFSCILVWRFWTANSN